MTEKTTIDHSAAIATALFMANLLFVIFGAIFYLIQWGQYLRRDKDASDVTQHHMKQALIASSITTSIFIVINIFILTTGGYVPLSLASLLMLEFYFMVIVPLFLVVGIFAFIKAVREEDFNYPLLNRLA